MPTDIETTPETEPRQSDSRTVSIRTSTLMRGLVAVALVAATIAFGGLWLSAQRDLRHRDSAAADQRHAEQVAGDYAVGAATIDYQRFPDWLTKLKAGTTTQLATKFDATGATLQQLIAPLQWTSTATPITAKATGESGGVYQVDVFLDVNTTSAQTPAGVRTTVTYRITVDRNADWKISDVGGMDGALPAR